MRHADASAIGPDPLEHQRQAKGKTMLLAVHRGNPVTRATTSLVAFIALMILVSCARPAPPLDITPSAATSPAAVTEIVQDPTQAETALISAGIADPARRVLIQVLVPEVLADLTLFGPGATARPRDVRIVVVGDGATDTVVSIRALPLYRTVANALVTGALPRLAVADRVLEARVAAITSNALDEGRQINGAVLTIVLPGLTQDGRALRISDE